MYYKKLEICVLFALCLSIILSCFDFSVKCSDIRERVFRLHILANSDSEYDQSLKLKVRDRLLLEGLEVFGESESLDETVRIANENLDEFCAVAVDELQKNGCNLKVTASVSPCYFNTRTYSCKNGEATLPAGTYTALQIRIGKSAGKNWWCVMYPSLCIASSAQRVEDVLPKDEAEIVENNDKFSVKFKILEWFEQIKSLF